MRRRNFIKGIVGSATVWPLFARAEQPNRMRRIGVLMSAASDDPLGQANSTAFAQGLQQLGWEVGRNVRIEYRWGGGDTERYRHYAAELVAWGPDVILATATSIVADLQQVSRTVPIVFVATIDPVGAGIVGSLSRPGGNATGFTAFEFSLSAKLLELLKEMAPNVSRVAVIRDPSVAAGAGGFAAIQTAAPSLGVELVAIGVQGAAEIETGITEFARAPNGGLIVVGPPSSMFAYRELVITLTSRHRLPAVYASLTFVDAGALISYGSNLTDQYRQAASYIDRILKGEKPADLPVQAATKFELVINLKAAKAIGLTVPPSLLARADEVID
jgi:putative tryptophan/tyrosine transport system substrate-binding protein